MSTIWNTIVSFFNSYFVGFRITLIDAIEMAIIAVAFYKLMMWFKKTRAWALFKGIIGILITVLLAAIFQFNTILWIATKFLSVGLIAIVVIFQPELRRALEQIGRGKFFRNLIGNSKAEDIISDENIDHILEAVEIMSSAHTGALICLEKDIALGEYENTGIKLDSVVSKQLLVNIFEDKTPLHDGAVIISHNLLTAATCYLPMSESLDVNKKYGTRHRAALGLSEVSDAMAIVVSEETGEVSVAFGGVLAENISHAGLKNRLLMFQNSDTNTSLADILKKGKRNGEV